MCKKNPGHKVGLLIRSVTESLHNSIDTIVSSHNCVGFETEKVQGAARSS